MPPPHAPPSPTRAAPGHGVRVVAGVAAGGCASSASAGAGSQALSPYAPPRLPPFAAWGGRCRGQRWRCRADKACCRRLMPRRRHRRRPIGPSQVGPADRAGSAPPRGVALGADAVCATRLLSLPPISSLALSLARSLTRCLARTRLRPFERSGGAGPVWAARATSATPGRPAHPGAAGGASLTKSVCRADAEHAP